MSPTTERFEVWGATGSGLVWDCQWPDCRAIATHHTRRGTGHPMPYMRVCERHMLEMRELPDQEAFAVSRARKMAQSHSSAGRVIQRIDDDSWGRR